MRNVTLKGLLAKKSRLLFTALAIVLGTAFLSATGVLSDSIRGGAEDVIGERPATATWRSGAPRRSTGAPRRPEPLTGDRGWTECGGPRRAPRPG